MQKSFFLAVLLALFSFNDTKLVRIKVADGISVMLPRDWHPMDELDFSERYPSVRAPLAAYTDESRQIDFSVNVSATQWPDQNAVLAQRFFKASLYNMFDRVEMISERIQTINKKEFICFEFESTVRGNNRELGQEAPVLRYSYIAYLVQPEKTLVFSFHCPRRLRGEWQETAGKIIGSIKVS